jgi:hypothetical protein
MRPSCWWNWQDNRNRLKFRTAVSKGERALRSDIFTFTRGTWLAAQANDFKSYTRQYVAFGRDENENIDLMWRDSCDRDSWSELLLVIHGSNHYYILRSVGDYSSDDISRKYSASKMVSQGWHDVQQLARCKWRIIDDEIITNIHPQWKSKTTTPPRG